MAYIGEILSIGVAFSWTAGALLSEYGSKRWGNLTLNTILTALALVFYLLLFKIATGSFVPAAASSTTMWWLMLSGFVGYVLCDYCLFQSYIDIGARYGLLFMTLAPLAAALMAWIILGQQLTAISILAMLITLSGIGISVLGRGGSHKVSLKLPRNGVLLAIGAAMFQGIGLVLSKIGLNHYEVSATGAPGWLIPFYANFYRCMVGCIGFAILMYFRIGVAPLRQAMHDRKGLMAVAANAIFGPFVGVALSLMAIQYTAAGIASTLMGMTPIIILLPSYWLFHEEITCRSVIGAVISVAGVSIFFLG